MVHVDPHTVKIIPQAAKRFMAAPKYAVVGRVLQDPAKFDNKVCSELEKDNGGSLQGTDSHAREPAIRLKAVRSADYGDPDLPCQLRAARWLQT